MSNPLDKLTNYLKFRLIAFVLDTQIMVPDQEVLVHCNGQVIVSIFVPHFDESPIVLWTDGYAIDILIAVIQ